MCPRFDSWWYHRPRFLMESGFSVSCPGRPAGCAAQTGQAEHRSVFCPPHTVGPSGRRLDIGPTRHEKPHGLYATLSGHLFRIFAEKTGYGILNLLKAHFSKTPEKESPTASGTTTGGCDTTPPFPCGKDAKGRASGTEQPPARMPDRFFRARRGRQQGYRIPFLRTQCLPRSCCLSRHRCCGVMFR